MKSRSLLLVGDPHAHPRFSNDRFTWLGRYIADTKPSHVHCTGDFADLPSLSRHDRGKLSFEGRRYAKDIEATEDALASIDYELESRGRPRFTMCVGNHEARISKFAGDHPELAGHMSVDDVPFRDYGWEVFPFLTVADVEGFAVCHYMQQGNTDRALGGQNLARQLLQKGYQSAIVGHDHRLMHATDVRWDGRRMHGISAGCFTHPNFVEDWSIQSAKLAWRGVIRLDGVRDGDFDKMTLVTLGELKKAYGGNK
jgi:hypothetical protein